jgi:succinate-acetate transporter protein
MTSPPAQIFLRPLGSPLPLGFLALAVGTFVLAGLQLDWISESQGHNVGLCLIAFVVPLQLISSILGFQARDVAAGTGMGLLTGAWLSIGLTMVGSPPGSISGALGLLLIAAAATLVVPAAAAMLRKPLGGAVIAVTVLRFASAGVYQLDGGDGWKSTTAVIGLVLAVLAWYAGCALALEDAAKRPVLPTLRTGRPDSGLGELENEPGVRAQL